MKIVYCVPQLFRPGGIERIISIKANWFADIANFEVIIVVSSQKNVQAYYPLSKKVRLVDLNIDYDELLHLSLIRRIYTKLRRQKEHKKKLETLLRQERPDITVSTFSHESAFLPKIKDSSKKVLEFHFCRWHKKMMADAFQFNPLTKLAYYFRCWEEENLIIPRYNQFVVLTKEDKQHWMEKIPNVKHIPNILPFERVGQATLDSHKVIAVGRLDAQKGFDQLIDIWNLIVINYPDWTLDIFGQGKDEEFLKKKITVRGLEGNVFIHRPDAHIKQRYLEASIFVMTSVYEGLPMTLLEAVGLGIPVVCYDFPCGPKDLITNGTNGFMVKQGNKEQFAERLCQLMGDVQLRKRMGQMAYELSQEYCKDSIMRQWKSLFECLSNNIESHSLE